jgi:hypothetical protein
MTCREAQNQMVLLLAGDLKPGERRSLEAHCRVCPACSRKAVEIEKDLEWLSRLPTSRPEFNWEASWTAVRRRMELETKTREPRRHWIRIALPVGSLAVLVLGFIIGRSLFIPSMDRPLGPSKGSDLAGRLILRHMEEVGNVFLEYVNRADSESDQRILFYVKQKVRLLLFQNRTLRASFEDVGEPLIIPLLNDLEIVLYEGANLETENPKGHEFIKALIQQKGLLFRIRNMEHLISDKAAVGVSP